MITLIIIGILLCISVIITIFVSRNSSCDFDTGVIIGSSMAILFAYEVYLLVNTINPIPSALDVYRGKTKLEITSVNGIPTDTVVVFKN